MNCSTNIILTSVTNGGAVILTQSDCFIPTLPLSAHQCISLDNEHALVLDLAGFYRLDAAAQEAAARWCQQQPLPVIGVGEGRGEGGREAEPAALRCVDVVVSAVELEATLANIKQCPQAAMVLVQVLRAVEKLPAEQGLFVESMGYATLQSGSEFARWLARYQPEEVVELNSPGPAVLMEREGEQLNLVLNRPEFNNAYDVEMRDALSEAFSLVNHDDSIQRVMVSALGRCFSVGGALPEFGAVSDPATAHQIRSLTLPARQLLFSAQRYHFHVHKACIGSGIELPAFAKVLTAAPKTFFWLPELSMGLIPGAGGCVSISKRIGRHKTAYMVLLNKKIDAKTALKWGLIDGIEALSAANA